MNAAVIVAIACGAMLAPQIRPGVTNKPVPLPTAASLTLEVQRSEAGVIGDIATAEEWVTSMSIASRGVLRLRFGIKEAGLTLLGPQPRAEWRVYEGIPALNDLAGTAQNLIARGDAGIVPTILKPREFIIDFGPEILPVSPNGKSYFVQVAGRNPDGDFTRISNAIALKYEASSWGSTIRIDSLKVVSVVPETGTLKGRLSVFEKLTPANSIETTFTYELASAAKGAIRWWFLDARGGSLVPLIAFDDWLRVQKGKGTAKGRMGLRCRTPTQDPVVVKALVFGLYENSVPLVSGEVPVRGVTFVCKP